MKKCLTDDLTPKSFRMKPPIKSQKVTRITIEYQKQLVLTKNDAKQRLRNCNIKVNDLSQELRSVLSDAHLEIIDCIKNKSKVKMYDK